MKMYVYRISNKNKQFKGQEICRSTGKVVFSDLFPSMQKSIETVEEVAEEKPKKARPKKAVNNKEVENVD